MSFKRQFGDFSRKISKSFGIGLTEAEKKQRFDKELRRLKRKSAIEKERATLAKATAQKIKAETDIAISKSKLKEERWGQEDFPLFHPLGGNHPPSLLQQNDTFGRDYNAKEKKKIN